jgi:hypothetical protein
VSLSLIPANSSLELAAAFNINERGEILGSGVPPGSSTDDASIGLVGHLFLLIPCGLEDQGDPDCSSSLQSGSTRQANTGLAKMGSLDSKGLTSESFAALLARLTHSHRALGNRTVIRAGLEWSGCGSVPASPKIAISLNRSGPSKIVETFALVSR